MFDNVSLNGTLSHIGLGLRRGGNALDMWLKEDKHILQPRHESVDCGSFVIQSCRNWNVRNGGTSHR